MAKLFPPIMTLGIDEPSRFEGEVFDLEVTHGAIPPEIDGLFVQAVPDHQFPPETPTVTLLDASAGGDGVVRTFRFKDGHVDFKTRYVRTERFLAERAARRSLFGHYRNPFSDHPSAAGKDRTTANTAVYFHAGTLLASKEDGPAYAVDYETLETAGPWRAGGAITSKTWTAHPKFDSKTGEMCGFGYAAKGECTRDVAYYVIDRKGVVTHEAWFEAPVSAMIHDCALTENFMIFPIMPYTSDLERLKRGGLHFQYEPQMEQIFGVLPRRGTGAQVRWFRAPPACPGHTVNAFEADGKICFDVLEAEGSAFGPVVPDANGYAPPLGSVTTRLVRWTIDYRADDLHLNDRRVLATVTGEGPHIDERFALSRYRYMWVPQLDLSRLATDQNSRPMPVLFNIVTRVDIETGERDAWYPGPAATFQDPVYFPRSPEAPEGEGYLVAIINWVLERRSELVVLDAMHLSRGPIARIRVPVRLRMGIHAAWIGGERLVAHT
jgi:carotenoid cleavage dioxygenase